MLRKIAITLTPHNNQIVQKAKNELDLEYIKEQESYIIKQVNDIENAHQNRKSKIVWSTVNEVSGRKNTKKGHIRASPE